MGFGEFGSLAKSTTKFVKDQVPQSAIRHGDIRTTTTINDTEKRSQERVTLDSSLDANNNLTPVQHCANCTLDLEFDLDLFDDDLTQICQGDRESLEALEGDTVAQILEQLEGEGGNLPPVTAGSDLTLNTGYDLAYPTTTPIITTPTPAMAPQLPMTGSLSTFPRSSSGPGLFGGTMQLPPLVTITQDIVTLAGLGLHCWENYVATTHPWVTNVNPVSPVIPQMPQIQNPGESLNPVSQLLHLPVTQTAQGSNLPLLAPQQNAPQIETRKRKPRQNRPQNSGVLPNIVICGVPITGEAWAKAFMEAEHGVSKAGNVLFDHLFSDLEVITSTKSGRGHTTALNSDKVKAITVAVTWMTNNRRDGQSPYNFQQQDVGTLSRKDSFLLDKVFVDRRNERKRKLKKKTTKKFGGGRKKNSGESSTGQLSPGQSTSSSSSNKIAAEIQEIIDVMAPFASFKEKSDKNEDDDDFTGCAKRPKI